MKLQTPNKAKLSNEEEDNQLNNNPDPIVASEIEVVQINIGRRTSTADNGRTDNVLNVLKEHSEKMENVLQLIHYVTHMLMMDVVPHVIQDLF